MYRVALAELFELDGGIALELDGLYAQYVQEEVQFRDRNGEPVDIEDSCTRITAVTLLIIANSPLVATWITNRNRIMTIIPNTKGTIEKLPPYEQQVFTRLLELHKATTITGGIVEGVIWDWEPGQGAGKVAVNSSLTRLFHTFFVRGNTLHAMNRITNITVNMRLEHYRQSNAKRHPILGELFPDKEDY
jgi:hypothetical protein